MCLYGASFLVSTQMAQRAMSTVSVVMGDVIRGSAAGARVFEDIKHTSDIPTSGGVVLRCIRGNIRFVDVTFRYPTRPGQAVFENFSFDIPAGKVRLIFGVSNISPLIFRPARSD